MADVAARREARRRKILENSEYRLQRITGQANRNEQSGDRCKKSIGAESPSDTSNSIPNGVWSNNALLENQSVDSLINELEADIDVEESTSSNFFTQLSTLNVPHRRNVERVNISSKNGDPNRAIKLNSSNDVRHGPERHDPMGDLLLSGSENVGRSTITEVEPTLIQSLLSHHLIYVALAIVVNVMVIFNLEHLFGMSMVVPFFVIMIGRLCACKNNGVSEGSNMLVAALILSNVKPDLVKVIYRVKGSFALSVRILKDFAVYMFAFVLIHTALHRYWSEDGNRLHFPPREQQIFDDIPM